MTLAVTKKRSAGNVPRIMDDFFNVNPFFGKSLLDFDGGLLNDKEFALVPEANIIENGKDYQIELAVPGLEKKDFNIAIENNMLTVSAEKEHENKTENKNYRSREFSYSSFYRSFVLPENLIMDKIDAKYDNGILKLILPKKEVTVHKPVKQIKVG